MRSSRRGGVPSLPVSRPIQMRGYPEAILEVQSRVLATQTMSDQGATSTSYNMSYTTTSFDTDGFGADADMRFGKFWRSLQIMKQNASNVPGIIVHRWLFTLKQTIRMNETDHTFFDIMDNVATQAGYTTAGDWCLRGANPLNVPNVMNLFKIKQLKSINLNPGKMVSLIKFKGRMNRRTRTSLVQLSSTGDTTTAGRKYNYRKGFTWLFIKTESPMIKGLTGNNGPAPAKVQDYIYTTRKMIQFTQNRTHTSPSALTAQSGTGRVYATTGALVADLDTF